MDPIQPIDRRSPWISELAAERVQGTSREHRKTPPSGDRKGSRRKPASDGPQGEQGSDGDGPEGRHIDVHA